MKKNIVSGILLLSSLAFTGCKDIKGDATKAADFECKGEALYKQMLDGDTSVKSEMNLLKEEYQKFREETKEKYKDASSEERKEFEKIFKERKEACSTSSAE